MASTEQRELLRALADRDIGLGEDDVAWAFQGPSTRSNAAKWVQEYLQSSTLLTKEELAFYHRHGIDTNPSAPGTSRPLTESELEAAMDSLEASTAALEKQFDVLQKQKLALRKLQDQSAPGRAGRDGPRSRHDRLAREKAQLDFDLDELSSTTGNRLQASLKLVESATGGIASHVDRLLEKDDRLLDGLQKLLPKLFDSSSDVDEAEEVEKLCSTLSALSIQEIHSRLDQTYRESVLDYTRKRTRPKQFSDQHAKQRETLRAELQELGGEIDGLVGIVVDHQYRKSLKRGMLSARADSSQHKARWSEYTVAVLLYLISKLDVIGEHVQQLHAHETALRTISDTLESALAGEQDQVDARTPVSPTPDRAATAAKGLKPLRLVQANMCETQDPALTFLRHHDVRTSDLSSIDKLAPLLHMHAREHHDQLSRLARSTEAGITDAVSQSFAPTQVDVQEFRRAVMAHSRFATVSLVDTDVQCRMDRLEQDIQRLGDEMRGLDADAIAQATKHNQEEVVRGLVT